MAESKTPSDGASTKRMALEEQTLEEAYAVPDNMLEIEVRNPETHGTRRRYTDYEVRTKTNNPIFKFTESSVRRRYRDFMWLKKELAKNCKISTPPLPGKALKRQLPFRRDGGLFDDDFIEDRRKALEKFLNTTATHPWVQYENCLHVFLQEGDIDDSYVPGMVGVED